MTSVPTYPNNERQNCEEPTIQTTETNVVHYTNREACMYIRPLQDQEGSNIIQSNVGHPPRNVPHSQVGRVRSTTITEREELKTTNQH